MELLQTYLISIMIYFIINMALSDLFVYKIEANGWLDNYDLDTDNDDDSDGHPYLMMLVMCAIPILRLMYCAIIIVMAAMTKEEYEKKRKELQEALEEDEDD